MYFVYYFYFHDIPSISNSLACSTLFVGLYFLYTCSYLILFFLQTYIFYLLRLFLAKTPLGERIQFAIGLWRVLFFV